MQHQCSDHRPTRLRRCTRVVCRCIGRRSIICRSVFSPAITGDTTFYVETRSGSGSSGCLRITGIEPEGTVDYVEIQNLSEEHLMQQDGKFMPVTIIPILIWWMQIPGTLEFSLREKHNTELMAQPTIIGEAILLWSANLGGWALWFSMTMVR